MGLKDPDTINASDSGPDNSLAKSLNKWDLLSIGVGAVIGWSWVIYAGVWSTGAGSFGGALAFIIGGILCTFIGFAYAELASAMPRAGGDMVYTFEGLGDRWAYFSGAFVGFGFLTLITVETIMLPVILNAIGIPLIKFGELYTLGGEKVYFSYILISLLVNFIFAYMNIKGIKFSSVFQTITVTVLLIAAVFYVFTGITLGESTNAEPFFTSFSGLSLTLLMVPGFMSGFNVVAQAAEETNVKPNVIGKLVVITVWASTLFYVLVIIGASFAANETMRETADVVVLESLVNLFQGSPYPKLFVALAALIGMLTSWNAAYVAASRVLFAFGRSKYFPKPFAELHQNNHTPYKSILILFVISSVATLLGTSQVIYTSIVDLSGFLLLGSWLLVVLSFMRLRKKAPDMQRPYKVRFGRSIGVLSILAIVMFLLLYTPLNPLGGLGISEITILSAILIIILAIYFTRVHHSRIGKEERRELLLSAESENID